MYDGLTIPGDLEWITLLVVLVAIAWRIGILQDAVARRAVAAGAGVALLGIPVMVLLKDAYSVPVPIVIAAFYGPVVTVVLLVWFGGRDRTGVPT